MRNHLLDRINNQRAFSFMTNNEDELLFQKHYNHSQMTQRAFRGTIATFLLRLISFCCTQLTLRYVRDPSVLGRATIQLDLYMTTVLFVSREGFRLALTKDIKDAQKTWSVAWLSIPTSILVSAVALVLHSRVRRESPDEDFWMAGIIFCISCLVEGLAEPAVLHVLREMNISVKAAAESLGTVGKSLATFMLLRVLQKEWSVTAFGLAQLVYAIIYSLVLWRSAWQKIDRSHILGPYDTHTCYSVLLYSFQGLFKHILTESDRLVLAILSGAYDQGVYAMASAYGSLAARMLLKPMEESARLVWSRMASDASTSEATQKSEIHQLQQSYSNAVKLVLYIGLVFACLAVNYTEILLTILAGRKWGGNQEAAAVLSAFCVYTAFMALNGMTEAFVYGVASTAADMGRLGLAHGAFAAAFAIIAPIAVAHLGTIGLVYGNCFAMFCRTMYSFIFAARYFSTRRTLSCFDVFLELFHFILPRPIVQLAFATCYVVTRWSRADMIEAINQVDNSTAASTWFHLASRHIAVGTAAILGLITITYYAEERFRVSLREQTFSLKID